jgi:hypothetical protein
MAVDCDTGPGETDAQEYARGKGEGMRWALRIPNPGETGWSTHVGEDNPPFAQGFIRGAREVFAAL